MISPTEHVQFQDEASDDCSSHSTIIVQLKVRRHRSHSSMTISELPRRAERRPRLKTCAWSPSFEVFSDDSGLEEDFEVSPWSREASTTDWSRAALDDFGRSGSYVTSYNFSHPGSSAFCSNVSGAQTCRSLNSDFQSYSSVPRPDQTVFSDDEYDDQEEDLHLRPSSMHEDYSR